MYKAWCTWYFFIGDSTVTDLLAQPVSKVFPLFRAVNDKYLQSKPD